MTEVKYHNGVPTLFVDGKPFPAAAYMTYLPEYGRYGDFARAGYGLFSLPVFFAGRSISATKGVQPFGKGIFDDPEQPDYAVFDNLVRRVLAAAPDAFVLPRVNLSLPVWWTGSHPDCLDGTGERESFYSEEAQKAAEILLRRFIRHVRQSDYADRIIGYHLAGGCTEEWFHFDLNGGFSPAALRGFQAFLAVNSPRTVCHALPDLSALQAKGPPHNNPLLSLFLEYANTAVVSYIEGLAAAAKEETRGRAVVGVFYGYTLEVTSPLYGTHALTKLLQCADIDFVSSPNSYIGVRDPCLDWTEMYPASSVRLHGKLCVQECDVRTHLTVPLSVAAPEYDPVGVLTAPVWHGLSDRKKALGQIRKSFCRQLINGNGFWWFDMWGGWYADKEIMTEMAAYRKICCDALQNENRGSVSEVAVFTDARAYYNLTDCPQRGAAHEQRKALGKMGAPYDSYDIADFNAVFQRYKAVVFLTGIATDALRAAAAACKKTLTPYLCNSEAQPVFSVDALRAFCKACGVHLYCDTDDIIYLNRNYFAVHAVSGGKKIFRFCENVTLRRLLDRPETLAGREAFLRMEKNETALFEIIGT